MTSPRVCNRNALEAPMTTGDRRISLHLEHALIDVAVESWRFSRLFARAVSKLDADESARYGGQLRFFLRKLEQSLGATGLSLVNVEGHPYVPGMAASALNLSDFTPDASLVVDQMVEPIVMGLDGLRRQGTVVLRSIKK